ncbi:alpha-hydroxy acid oxidase [Massilia timonae]|uniref:alpha-hydroxy acid oxidase n=1 Tax=Massilia timonae TaxID=47229 RepID=UPI0028D6C719|nr:alpha-hydroxy acid oxidase [Massilia timonae]
MNASARLARAATIDDLRGLARARLPRMVFDYIDGASGMEATARRNRSGFDRFLLRPDIMADVSSIDLSTTVLGERLAMPFVIGPTGLNGAFWPEGDLCIARAARAGQVPFVMSTAATSGLDPVVAVAGPLRWFQLYLFRDRALVGTLLERVRAAGFTVLQVTVDTPLAGRRNRDIRNGFSLPFRWSVRNLLDTALHPGWALQMLGAGTPRLRLFAEFAGQPGCGQTIAQVLQQQISRSIGWDDVAWLRAQWPGKLVLKGVGLPAHIRQAVAAGVDGVVVSNHGGRQLDGAPSTIETLPCLVDAAAGSGLELLIDSGFRCGADAAKALALGAAAVQLGRPTLYGLAAAGEAGVRHALRILADDLALAVALSGASTVAGLRGKVDPG